jgi:hypothetical protein
MSKKINKYISFILFLIVVGSLIYRQKKIQEVLLSYETQQAAKQIPTLAPSANLEFRVGKDSQKEAYEFTATVSGQNALELAQSQAKLDLKKYDFGTMVEGVAGLMADSKHYWAIYQDGEYAKTGIADIKLEKGEKIELKYEEIKL